MEGANSAAVQQRKNDDKKASAIVNSPSELKVINKCETSHAAVWTKLRDIKSWSVILLTDKRFVRNSGTCDTSLMSSVFLRRGFHESRSNCDTGACVVAPLSRHHLWRCAQVAVKCKHTLHKSTVYFISKVENQKGITVKSLQSDNSNSRIRQILEDRNYATALCSLQS